MFKKCMYIYLSLFFMNMHSMEDSVVLRHKLITPKMVPYMKTIANIFEGYGLDLQRKNIDYLSGCKEWAQKPMFAPTLELLSECIDVINGKSISIFEEKDWGEVYALLNDKNMSLSELIGMLEIVDFFEIDLFKKIILEKLYKSIVLNPNNLAYIKHALNYMQTHNNTLKHLLYNHYVKVISEAGILSRKPHDYNSVQYYCCDEGDDSYDLNCSAWYKYISEIENSLKEDYMDVKCLFDILGLVEKKYEHISKDPRDGYTTFKALMIELKKNIKDFTMIVSEFQGYQIQNL